MHKHKKHRAKDKSRGHFLPGIEPQARLDVEPRPSGHGLAIGFFGASGTVTGSRYLLEDDSTRILVDCGLFQGGRELRGLNWAPPPPEVDDVETILLTHAHLDHSGAIPRLVRNGWKGRVIATRATAELCELLLPDSGHLQEKDAQFANRRGYSRHRPALPLYTQNDALNALEHFEGVAFDAAVEVAPGISARFRRAGHILGAASIEIDWKGTRILFSGDLGRYDDAVMFDPTPPPEADYLIVESTYGDREHDALSPELALGDTIERCIARGGTVVIPAFAVGRAQSLLYYLSLLKQAGRLQGAPVYLDSPMAIDASEIMCAHSGGHRLSREQCKTACAVAHYVRESEESKALTADRNPKVIISASGMATGGRVLHHLAQFAPDPKNLILFAGFQAVGTRGAALVAGATSIRIFGEEVPVLAEVSNLSMLSAHADCNEIMRWLSGMPKAPRRTFVTHGEASASAILAQRIVRELGWHCETPRLGSWGDMALATDHA
ncbi:MBL fold metallo-hydrolase [Blastomonas sp. UPD001]|uniref:MBL fold metallo-hydrolase RNA specificity domain-containing protein n=1 Tax=Blastomonas sp. UPD001 TaxID=2217673 RepID=UPI000E3515B7|nr:MBL fold metallo-hydrolase [Blastomonas sp. UPD001]